MKPLENDYTRQLALIRDHLDAMLDDKLAEDIGATKDRALHIRVLRVLDRLNDERAENANLREALEAYAIPAEGDHWANGYIARKALGRE